MIGFTQYSPAVLSLLIDRDKFCPFIIHNTSELTLSKAENFINTPDGRFKVVMFSKVDTLAEVAKKLPLDDVKVIVLDTVLNLSRVTLEIKDAQQRADSVQFFSITPSALNKALEACAVGIPEDGISDVLPTEPVNVRATIIRKNISSSSSKHNGELSSVVGEIISHLGEREKLLAVEAIMKYIVGIIGKRQFNTACIEYDLAKLKLNSLIEFIQSVKGKALRLAFMDMYIYSTAEIDVEAKVNKLDFDFLRSILPLTNKYEFVAEVPKSLVRQRKKEM